MSISPTTVNAPEAWPSCPACGCPGIELPKSHTAWFQPGTRTWVCPLGESAAPDQVAVAWVKELTATSGGAT